MKLPLKIIRRVAEAPAPAIATPGVPSLAKRSQKPLSLMGKQAIKNFITGSPSQKQAMLDAGFAANTAINPGKNLFNKPEAKEEVQAFVDKLIALRDDLVDHLKKTVKDASHGEAAMSFNQLVKTIQLLTGKMTGRIGIDLDPEDQSAIKEILKINIE